MKAVITLDQNAPARIDVEKYGTERSIYMNLQELANFLVNSIKQEDIEIEEKPQVVTASPSLPPNTIKYARLSDDTDLIFLFHPETKSNVTYHGTLFKDVPFPNLVFCFGVKKNRLIKKHVLVYKDLFLRDNTEMYSFPFSNVFSGGKLCYYDNTEVHDLVQLQTFPYNWLHEPFNDHLYRQGYSNKWNKSLREIFMITQGKSFDYDMLISEKMTFAQWADGLLS